MGHSHPDLQGAYTVGTEGHLSGKWKAQGGWKLLSAVKHMQTREKSGNEI